MNDSSKELHPADTRPADSAVSHASEVPMICDPSLKKVPATAVVVQESPDGTRVLVRQSISGCDGCHSSGVCNLMMRNNESYETWARNRVGARVGQKVRIEFDALQKVKTACVLFLLPSICIALGVGLGSELIGPSLGVEPSLAGLLAALVLLPVGLLPAFLANRRGTTVPVVVEIVMEVPGGLFAGGLRSSFPGRTGRSAGSGPGSDGQEVRGS